MPDGEIVTGRTSDLLGPSAAALLNAVKHLAGIDDEIDLIPAAVIEPIQRLKCSYLGNHNPRLHSDEILVALSISAAGSDISRQAMEMLPALRNCEAHSTVILPHVDDNIYRRLGIRVTQDPQFQVKKLFHR